MLRSSATSYYQVDGLGSVTSLTNVSGAAAETYTYDSFGKVTASAGSLTNPFQYTGRESDNETGLYYYRARYYDSATGRFANEDPSQLLAGINMYVYAGGNPTNLIDPSGLAAQCKDVAELAGLGTDSGLLARLIYLESTGANIFFQNRKQDMQNIGDDYLRERNAVAATVFNRLNNSSFGNHSTIAGVIGAVNAYQGMGDGKGNVQISIGNVKKLNNVLNSPCTSTDCSDLLASIYVANQWVSGAGIDPFEGTVGMYARGGRPKGNFDLLPGILGSGNDFFRLRK
jgi:RHS repeat-associated protein